MQRLPILLQHISIPDPVHPEAQQLSHLLQITTHILCPHTHQLPRVSAGRYNPLRSHPSHLVEGQKRVLNLAGIRDFSEQSRQNERVLDGLTGTLALVRRGRVGCITHHYNTAFCVGRCWPVIPHSP